ncbi:RecX family transcriptional regulator [Candidatus Gracilibacteria bacterium]|nr:RecX family transcriptional regulator [Candidatus Gracilibacteria bacterium]
MSSCFQLALKYISRYPKTEKELSIYLFKKGFLNTDVVQTIKKLKEIGYVDDSKFVQSYINSELSKKGKPIILIKQKLIQKGVDKNTIDKLMQDNSEDIKDGIYKKIQKEIQTYKKKGIDGFDIIQKLMRKGYKLDDIKSVIQNK